VVYNDGDDRFVAKLAQCAHTRGVSPCPPESVAPVGRAAIGRLGNSVLDIGLGRVVLHNIGGRGRHMGRGDRGPSAVKRSNRRRIRTSVYPTQRGPCVQVLAPYTVSACARRPEVMTAVDRTSRRRP